MPVDIAGEVPDEIRGVDEHRPGPGADPVQSPPGRHPIQSPRATEGHQGSGRHVARTRERLRLYDGRQGNKV